MSVNFFKEGIRFRISKKTILSEWIRKQILKNGFKLSDVNFIFCNDKFLRSINKEYLNHDYFTDIVTFDNSTDEKEISGDIFISVDRVKVNAKIFDTTFDDELNRVMAHGVLHLIGYSDKNEQKKKVMRRMEDQWLEALNR